MVRAGQEGGFLEDVLKRIADFTEHQEDLKAKVIGALAYPVFLAVAGFIVLNILVIFFVPKFEPIFEKLKEKGELPDPDDVPDGLQPLPAGSTGGLIIGLFIGWLSSLFRRWARRAMAGRRGPIAAAPAAAVRADLPEPRPWPDSPASWAPCCTTASRSSRRCNIAKDSTGNRVLAEAIEQVGREHHRRARNWPTRSASPATSPPTSSR